MLVPAGLRFLRRRRRAVAAVAGWSAVEALQTFLLGHALARAVDRGFLADRPGVGLGWLAVAAVGVAVGAFGTLRVYGAVARLTEDLRDTLVRRVVTGSLERAAARGRAEGPAAVSRLTHQVEIARDGFAGLVMVTRSFVVTAAAALLGLLTLAPPLLLVVLPPLAAGLAVFGFSLRPLSRCQRDFLAADEALAAELGAVVDGLRDVVACGGERRAGAAVRARVDAELRASTALARWGTARDVAVGVGGRLPVVALLLAAPWLLSRGVTAGALVGALAYLTQALLPALQSLVFGLGGTGARLTVVAGRLYAAGPPGGTTGAAAAGGEAAHPPTDGAAGSPLATGKQYRAGPPHGAAETGAHRGDAEQPAADGAAGSPRSRGAAVARADRAPAPGASLPGPPAAPALAGPAAGGPPAPGPGVVLELRRVSFRYGPRSDAVIRGLDLVVRDGEHLAVVGPSGIGKSTLASLAAGLVAPGTGEVRRAGRPLLLPQEAYVFGGTLRDNLAYLCPSPVGDAELHRSAHAVGAEPLVARLGGLDARLRPAELSAGERQLLALARAHVAPPRLALLDEATCHLDPAAEARAERAFARRPASTLVVVAHRVASAARADRVLVLDGRSALAGTHRELLARSPFYRELTGAGAGTGASTGTGGATAGHPPVPAHPGT
ncbi:ABC transporter ATP-binding protein [Streptomyces sp. WMMC500]|uniref:ATP-binding cassette domain-containing protein n=1 Tax=Streptomyces sp. WMMC500 TaxID=3015154 RepID=UPI00248B2186|nr:ABC transporter ATP-binding protein [Streptomyces sp. WMMC500]WBB64404.1 ABC transporter ATP-binding protein [Streptomyces sp. WMMC500]